MMRLIFAYPPDGTMGIMQWKRRAGPWTRPVRLL